jgi:hypothetical protein
MARISAILLILCSIAGAQVVSTGNHRHVSISGTTNHARQFNGTSDFLQSASSLSLTGLTTATIALEFRLYWNAFSNTDEIVFETSTNFSSNVGAFIVNPNSSGTGGFEFSVRDGTNFLSCWFARPSAAAWHSYVLNWNSSAQTCSAWVDGVSQTVTVAITGTATQFTSQVLYVGSRAGTSFFSAGRLSEIAIINGTPNGTDAASFSACGRPTAASGTGSVVYYWPINQTSPEVATTGGINLNVNGTTNVASQCSF